MNIFPVHADQLTRRHWIVRCLRFLGYCIPVVSTLIGFLHGSVLLGILLPFFGMAFELAGSLGTVLGGLIGLIGGLISSLPVWAFALVVEDIHALRVYASGYASSDNGDAEQKPQVTQ